MQEYDFLLESNLSKMNYQKISKNNLRVDQPTVFMTIPDTNLNIWNIIYDNGILKTNCEGIVVPNKTFKINNKTFLGRAHHLDVKKNLSIKKDKGKKFKIINKLDVKDITNKSKKYWVYDMSLYSQALKYGNEKFSLLLAANKLISQITKEYTNIKKLNPAVKVEMFFMIKNQNGVLFEILKNYKKIFNEKILENNQFFDNFCFVCNCDNNIIPIMYKDKGKPKLIVNHLNSLTNYLNNEEVDKEINSSSILKDEEPEEKLSDKEKEIENILPKKKDNFDGIIDDLNKVKLSTKKEDGEFSVEINNKKLSTILKKYKINDPDVVANVKASLDNYIKIKGDKLTKDEAETIVFHAIHFSVYGTDQIRPEFLVNPEKLINKIKDTRIHKTPLIFPKNLSENIINPNDIIDIKYTTGAWRQRNEFEDTIHKNVEKLFKTLETTSATPVKVKEIKHKYVDDDLNRQIRYEITLQNTGGGLKEPYKVYLNVPGVINDRYMKMNGVPYIMPVQQFMKPVTKTVKDDVRLLTNYAIMQLKLENVKFTPSELPKIINYIQIKYPKLIKKYDEKTGEIQLTNKSIMNLIDNPVLKTESIEINYKNQKLTDNNDNEIKQGKQEYLYNALIETIQTVNPDDQLSKTSKSIPYLSIYLGGFKVPFIIYLWQQKGLLTALNDFGVDYEINAKKSKNDTYTVRTKDGYLIINPESRREKLFCNGLLQIKLSKIFDNLDEPTEIHDVLNRIYGQRAVFNMNEMNENMIDVITKELLEFEGLPTNLNNLLSNHCVDILLNNDIDNIADLKVYRARLSEMLLNIMYSQVKMSMNEYRKKVLMGDETAKINMYSDFIIDTIYEHAGVLNYTEPTNPIDEIIMASKTIRTGPGGIKNRQTFRKEHRNIHPSHIGNLGANATSESGNTGLDTAHTLTPAILNEYGGYGRKSIDRLGPWDSLAMNEAIIPMINSTDADRAVMATTHAKQVTATNGNEPPLIGTGGEYIVTQLASRRFIQKANKSGKVVEVVKNKYVTVKYDDGTIESFDIYSRMSRTKMASFIPLDMNTLEVGDKVSKNQPVAWTKNFSKSGLYCSGANVTMAIMQYMGNGHEDAYVISENFSERMNRDIVREVSIIVPPDVKILNLVKEVGQKTSKEDVLVEFQYEYSLDDYLDKFDVFDSNDFDDDDLSDDTMIRGGQKSIKLMSKSGEITSIQIFINTKNSIDKQVVSLHKKLVKETRDTIQVLEDSYKNENDKIKASDNIPLKFTKIGGHKIKGAEFTGARIVYLIKQSEPLKTGDKLAGRYGTKGVISSDIIPKDLIPKSKRHDLDIDTFISPSGIYGRKSVAMIKELYLGKVIYFLNKQIKEMANDTKIKTNEIIKLVLDVYGLIGGDKSKKLIEEFFKNNSEASFRKRLKNDSEFNLFFPVIPFTTISFKDIHKAADLIEVELDEYVYIPELKTTTKTKVPVGIMYMQVLEQTSQSYASVRSVGKYQGGTRQATKGKSNQGGQAIGQLDINALLTYDAPDMLNELLTLRSDEHQSKQEVFNNIINTGSSDIPKYIKQGATNNLLDVYMTSMGLITL